MNHCLKQGLLLAGLAAVPLTASAELALFYPHTGEVGVLDPVEAAKMGDPRGTVTITNNNKLTAPTFNITYNDVVNTTNVGFGDPSTGATRRATFESIFTYLATVINDSGTCDILVNNSQTDGTGALASAGTLYFTGTPGFQGGVAFEHITTGVDVGGGSNPDISVTVDFGYTWNSGLGAPASGEFDLVSVLLHEVTHGLGIASLTTSTGASQFGNNERTTFDELIVTGGLAVVWNPAFTQSAGALTCGDNCLLFNGTDAIAQLGATPDIYAPTTFASGSSISHWNTNSANGTVAAAVMVHAIAPTVQKRTYQPFEIGALKDLGYNVNLASEVQAWEMY